MATTRNRRTRRYPAHVIGEIRKQLLQNVSPAQVRFDLEHRLRWPSEQIPSARTISDIKREMHEDESGIWTIEEADPASARLMIRLLNIVVRASEGSITHLTRREAHLLPLIYRAGHGRYSPWQAYIWTRFYISWVRTDRDAEDILLALAAPPENSTELHGPEGYVQRKGSWPVALWARLDRVFDALATWQVEQQPADWRPEDQQ